MWKSVCCCPFESFLSNYFRTKLTFKSKLRSLSIVCCENMQPYIITSLVTNQLFHLLMCINKWTSYTCDISSYLICVCLCRIRHLESWRRTAISCSRARLPPTAASQLTSTNCCAPCRSSCWRTATLTPSPRYGLFVHVGRVLCLVSRQFCLKFTVLCP